MGLQSALQKCTSAWSALQKCTSDYGDRLTDETRKKGCLVQRSSRIWTAECPAGMHECLKCPAGMHECLECPAEMHECLECPAEMHECLEASVTEC